MNGITHLFCDTTLYSKKLRSEINVSWPIYSCAIHKSEKNNSLKEPFWCFSSPPPLLQCVSAVEAQDFVGKTEIRLMFHEDHGEFILIGVLTLNHIAMIFFISHREQVSQLTGVNTENSVMNKKRDTHKSVVGFSLAERFQNLCASPC